MSKIRRAAHWLMFGKNKPAVRAVSKTDMSRSTQTWIIAGILGVMALYGYDYSLKHDRNDPNAPCNSIFGYDQACRASMAAARMRGGY